MKVSLAEVLNVLRMFYCDVSVTDMQRFTCAAQDCLAQVPLDYQAIRLGNIAYQSFGDLDSAARFSIELDEKFAELLVG